MILKIVICGYLDNFLVYWAATMNKVVLYVYLSTICIMYAGNIDSFKRFTNIYAFVT